MDSETGPCTDLGELIAGLRDAMPQAGFGVPAAAMAESGSADWSQLTDIAVYAADDTDLDLLAHNGIGAQQVIMTAGQSHETVDRAMAFGVSRYIVGTAADVETLARHTQRPAQVYLDCAARVPEPQEGIEVVGLHCEIDDSIGYVEWATAVDRMLCRLAYLRSCALRPVRLSLVGSSEGALEPIAEVVDEALELGCERWRLARPDVIVAPGMANAGSVVAA